VILIVFYDIKGTRALPIIILNKAGKIFY